TEYPPSPAAISSRWPAPQHTLTTTRPSSSWSGTTTSSPTWAAPHHPSPATSADSATPAPRPRWHPLGPCLKQSGDGSGLGRRGRWARHHHSRIVCRLSHSGAPYTGGMINGHRISVVLP